MTKRSRMGPFWPGGGGEVLSGNGAGCQLSEGGTALNHGAEGAITAVHPCASANLSLLSVAWLAWESLNPRPEGRIICWVIQASCDAADDRFGRNDICGQSRRWSRSPWAWKSTPTPALISTERLEAFPRRDGLFSNPSRRSLF